MNEDGLVVSLTRGGSGRGRGFAVILMLRYVLETCRSVSDAVAALCRIPIAQGQNVTRLDKTGAYATLFLGPDREPAVHAGPRLHEPSGAHARAGSDSDLRHRTLTEILVKPGITLTDLASQFLRPPLYSRRAAFTTVYTAIYRPAEGRVDYLWPGQSWTQSFERFDRGRYTHHYGTLFAAAP